MKHSHHPSRARRGVNFVDTADVYSRGESEQIDLYQIHRWDLQADHEETLSALTELVHAGKIRYLGCRRPPRTRSSKRGGSQNADARRR
jgi:aryl-alcohol dehydrogenase-like predicted oxidoreductase